MQRLGITQSSPIIFQNSIAFSSRVFSILPLLIGHFYSCEPHSSATDKGIPGVFGTVDQKRQGACERRGWIQSPHQGTDVNSATLAFTWPKKLINNAIVWRLDRTSFKWRKTKDQAGVCETKIWRRFSHIVYHWKPSNFPVYKMFKKMCLLKIMKKAYV